MARPRAHAMALLGLGPPVVMFVWVLGVMADRGQALAERHWPVLAMAIVALALTLRQWQRRRPRPQLPPTANWLLTSLLAAALIALLALLLGYGGEWLADRFHRSEQPLWQRLCWHSGCAFAAAGCYFLRLLLPNSPPAGAHSTSSR